MNLAIRQKAINNLSDLQKSAQSIVFGGGPPSGNTYGSPVDLPRQNPLRTMGQLGDALSETSKIGGRLLGHKMGWNPRLTENAVNIGTYVTPVLGTARSIGDVLSNYYRGNKAETAWGIASTPALVRAALPKVFHAGLIAHGLGTRAYSKAKPLVSQLGAYINNSLNKIQNHLPVQNLMHYTL